MSKVFLVWNHDRSECIGFTDLQDAEEAAGVRKIGGSCACLTEEFRSLFAEEDAFDQPEDRMVFEIQAVEV